MFSRSSLGCLFLATLMSAVVSPALSDTNIARSAGNPELVGGDRPDFAAGLYDIKDYDEVLLDVNRLTSQPIYQSTLGYYLATASGRPLTGEIIWPDASAGKPTALAIDLNRWPEAKAMGFFIIPHGAVRNQQLKSQDVVSFSMVGGRWTAFHKGKSLQGRNASLFATDARLNDQGQRQVLVNADDGTFHWAERPALKAETYSHLKEKVDIIVRKAAASAPGATPPGSTTTATPAVTSAANGGVIVPSEYDIKGADSVILDLKALPSNSPYRSSFGYYLTDKSDYPVRGEVVWADINQASPTTTLRLSRRVLGQAKSIGFFIIPNGAVLNPNLRDDTPVTFANNVGEWAAVRYGISLDGATLSAFFSNVRWNADGTYHAKDSSAPGNLNWEDQYLGQSGSFDDVNLDVSVMVNMNNLASVPTAAAPLLVKVDPPKVVRAPVPPSQPTTALVTPNAGAGVASQQVTGLVTAPNPQALAEQARVSQPPAQPVQQQQVQQQQVAETRQQLARPARVDSFWGQPVFSGFGEAEISFFPAGPQFDRQSNEEIQQSVAGSIQYAQDAGTRSELLLNLLGRYDQIDNQRSFVDVQQAHVAYFGNVMSVRAGVLNETWGVLELENIVDVVNQRNIVDDFRADSKLGQPGVKLGFPILSFGQADLYYLPFPRRRPFPGNDGRFQLEIPIDDDNAFYESSADTYEELFTQQFAGRMQFLLGDVETSLSHFYGTSRDPVLNAVVQDNTAVVVLEPDYDLINQTGLELRALGMGNVYKAEAFRRTGADIGDEDDAIYGFGLGIERDLVRVFDSDIGMTLIGEYYYDSRDVADEVAPAALENDLFLASRMTFSDVADTQLLLSGTFDLGSQGAVLSTELKRRIGESLQVSLKGDVFVNVGDDAAQVGFKDDHRIQARIRYFY